MRVSSLVAIRPFCESVSAWQPSRSKKRVVRVLTLLTFCPPGPLLRLKLNQKSSSGINRRRSRMSGELILSAIAPIRVVLARDRRGRYGLWIPS